MEIEELKKALQKRKAKPLLLIFGLFGMKGLLLFARIHLYLAKGKSTTIMPPARD